MLMSVSAAWLVDLSVLWLAVVCCMRPITFTVCLYHCRVNVASADIRLALLCCLQRAELIVHASLSLCRLDKERPSAGTRRPWQGHRTPWRGRVTRQVSQVCRLTSLLFTHLRWLACWPDRDCHTATAIDVTHVCNVYRRILANAFCYFVNVYYFNTTVATAELSRQLMCIVKCHSRVYSSFSTCNSAVYRHHSR